MCVSFNEDLLVCAGLLAMLLAHLRGGTAAACAAFAAALLSKERRGGGAAAGAGPRLPPGRRPELARRRGAHAAYAALLAVYLYLRLGPLSGPGSGPPLALPLLERLQQAAKALAASAGVFADPVALRIEYFALPLAAWEGPAYAAAAAALLAGAGWALLRLRRREPAAALAVLWPFPFLAAVSPLLPANQLEPAPDGRALPLCARRGPVRARRPLRSRGRGGAAGALDLPRGGARRRLVGRDPPVGGPAPVLPGERQGRRGPGRGLLAGRPAGRRRAGPGGGPAPARGPAGPDPAPPTSR